MAIIKAVSSKQNVRGIIHYVTKKEKTEEKLISGYNCTADNAYKDMNLTKELWGKTGGRTYKHYVQSFAPEENISPELAHDIAYELVEKCPYFRGFEVLIATHKDREHIHTHFIVNSVSFESGKKFHVHKGALQNIKDLSDEICNKYGLDICEKGKTFSGAEREETTAYRKETYQLLKKAERGEVKSFVMDIALKIMKCKEQATSREDFIDKMLDEGVVVDWQDSHKYITFTDLELSLVGTKQCKVRNNKLEQYYNIDFSKEGLENEFEGNLRAEERARARQQNGYNRRTNEAIRRTAEVNTESYIGEAEVIQGKPRPEQEDNGFIQFIPGIASGDEEQYDFARRDETEEYRKQNVTDCNEESVREHDNRESTIKRETGSNSEQSSEAAATAARRKGKKI